LGCKNSLRTKVRLQSYKLLSTYEQEAHRPEQGGYARASSNLWRLAAMGS